MAKEFFSFFWQFSGDFRGNPWKLSSDVLSYFCGLSKNFLKECPFICLLLRLWKTHSPKLKKHIWAKGTLIILACVDTIFITSVLMRFFGISTFSSFFSLWLTCRAKQFSSADVEGTDGDNKGARGDAEGVQKLPKKPKKVQKKP